ncbi:MAG TPA: carboxylating nicotinate-nucleotide diphosphorylase [Kiritimatiellia bacterium]|nr:carboxylating nicotinate-nucleotide diphosphorylase [Kiritimatiellia bacterium]HRZ13009.1 carboxylating nicotinate-nucleotide diphosphorylase [Kiritimatiellia bacterium]HSA18381.1 carboxylating nicotinate-nucleotide diphosphorylase [Kiritimatiellia bacterium]
MMTPLPDLACDPRLAELVRRALEEDLGAGDCTSEALIGAEESAGAAILSRGSCVVAGLPVAAEVFRQVDAGLDCRVKARDGDPVERDQEVLVLWGRARSILAAERVALNFLQRLSGIATLTRQFARKAAPYGVQILDTRKTTPTLRFLEKYAVLCGGGANHRIGLYDRVLIKDNHRAAWSRRGGNGLAGAVEEARRRFPGLVIEIEVENEDELREALAARPDWILLDNMKPGRLARCVTLAKGLCKLEASGGITLKTVEAVARTGVDALSVGALTHSAPAADFSLEFGAGA